MSGATYTQSAKQETRSFEQVANGLPGRDEIEQERTESAPSPRADIEAGDDELVLLARQGDRDAFAKLTRRHHAICLKRARLMLRNHTDAEDQVQSAFAKAFEYLEQFRCEGPFAAWLCRIVQNECLMLMRERRQAELIYVDVRSESKARLEIVDQLPDQEDGLGSQQVVNLLHREISRIPPLMRNVIILREIEELPMPEVAVRLHLSVPAAKSRLMRARKELRVRLAKYCGRTGPRMLMSKSSPNKIEYTYLS